MTGEWKLGAHMSIAGGLHLALEGASRFRMGACQIFTKNSNQWNARELGQADIVKFGTAWKSAGVGPVISHASYLINLASPKEDLRQKSINAMLIELYRAASLSLGGVVVHPGAHVENTEQQGIDLFKASIETILSKYGEHSTKLLIENTAGQGTTLGRSARQLGSMLAPFLDDDRIGVCIDSCHAHASGYDLTEESGLNRLTDELAEEGLLSKTVAIHLNDSKKPSGSRIDRHEHIGLGTIGYDGISRFIHHPEIKKLPIILETEKGTNEEGREWDWVNMQTLHKMIGTEYVPYELVELNG